MPLTNIEGLYKIRCIRPSNSAVQLRSIQSTSNAVEIFIEVLFDGILQVERVGLVWDSNASACKTTFVF